VRDISTIIISAPSKSRHVSIVSSDDVDDSKVVEDVYVLFMRVMLIPYEGHAFYEGTSEIVDAIVESNISTKPSKSFEFPCADDGLMIVLV